MILDDERFMKLIKGARLWLCSFTLTTQTLQIHLVTMIQDLESSKGIYVAALVFWITNNLDALEH